MLDSWIRLAPLGPSFVSVTYGAGGSTRDATLETLRAIGGQTTLRAAGHLTCVGSSREDVDATIRAYWDAGVRCIIALRGEQPELREPFVPDPKVTAGSSDLISAIRQIAPFEVSVPAYRIHPESRSLAGDLELLARKVDAGATRAITQFCFLTERVARFRDHRPTSMLRSTVPGWPHASTGSVANGRPLPLQAFLAPVGKPFGETRRRSADAHVDRGDHRRTPDRGAALRGLRGVPGYHLNQADVRVRGRRLLDLRPGVQISGGVGQHRALDR